MVPSSFADVRGCSRTARPSRRLASQTSEALCAAVSRRSASALAAVSGVTAEDSTERAGGEHVDLRGQRAARRRPTRAEPLRERALVRIHVCDDELRAGARAQSRDARADVAEPEYGDRAALHRRAPEQP